MCTPLSSHLCLHNCVFIARMLQPGLNRFDLFHAHLFAVARRNHTGGKIGGEDGGLGLLFHAREYPALDTNVWPHNLGFCQRGSRLHFDARQMDLRNIVYYQACFASCSTWSSGIQACSPALCLLLTCAMWQDRIFSIM